jgi:hypothetical protein
VYFLPQLSSHSNRLQLGTHAVRHPHALVFSTIFVLGEGRLTVVGDVHQLVDEQPRVESVTHRAYAHDGIPRLAVSVRVPRHGAHHITRVDPCSRPASILHPVSPFLSWGGVVLSPGETQPNLGTRNPLLRTECALQHMRQLVHSLRHIAVRVPAALPHLSTTPPRPTSGRVLGLLDWW